MVRLSYPGKLSSRVPPQFARLSAEPCSQRSCDCSAYLIAAPVAPFESSSPLCRRCLAGLLYRRYQFLRSQAYLLQNEGGDIEGELYSAQPRALKDFSLPCWIFSTGRKMDILVPWDTGSVLLST